MTEFEVKGPFQVPLRKQKTGGIVISEDDLPLLFESCSSFNTLGCYIYSRKSGRGSTPIYVGMTHRTIAKEAFNSSNLKKVENWLNEQNHRKLQIWTVTQKCGTKKNRSAVSEIETTLITWAKQENPNLINIQKSKRKERWTIYGVNSHGRGKVSNTSKEFKRMIGIR